MYDFCDCTTTVLELYHCCTTTVLFPYYYRSGTVVLLLFYIMYTLLNLPPRPCPLIPVYPARAIQAAGKWFRAGWQPLMLNTVHH